MIAALPLILACGLAAIVSAALCVLLRPLLLRYALARPNARSSHRIPTPQGGGIAVLTGAFLATGVAAWAGGLPLPGIVPLLLATTLLAILGAWDDIRPLPASLRLLLQAGCVALVLAYAVPELRLFPEIMPLWTERALALLAGVWFVNLVNFIDGLDWITVAGLVPLAGAIALSAKFGFVDAKSGLIAAALCGALIGFAPFNRPVAKLFLGDVGSLPLGLVTAYLLYRVAGQGGFTAALILPLYAVTDATITLIRRLVRGERVWEAHRSHFYQQATDNGLSVLGVVGRIAALNFALCGLALASLTWTGWPVQIACLAAAWGLTGLLLAHFACKGTPRG